MNIYVPKPEEIPSGLCECGCGGQTELVTITVTRRRHFRGHPKPFVRGHGGGPRRRGPDHWRWTGGRLQHGTGYVLLRKPEHPDADQKGYVREHRWVMEQQLGRPLQKWEHVHHINGVKNDNRPENLVVMTKAAHNAEHAPLRVYTAESRRKMSEAGRRGALSRWSKPRG